MSVPENPAAFPCVGFGPAAAYHLQEGMSLRDWFAGQALAGYTSCLDLQMAAAKVAKEAGRPVEAEIAEAAYSFADAMLAERSKANPTPENPDERA